MIQYLYEFGNSGCWLEVSSGNRGNSGGTIHVCKGGSSSFVLPAFLLNVSKKDAEVT